MTNVYKTSDLNEAVVLLCYDHKLEYIDKTERRAQFCFTEQSDTAEVIKNYRLREIQIEPHSFYQHQRDLKDRLYNG